MVQSTAKILISCFKDPFIPGRNVWKQAPSFIRLKGRAHHEFWHTSPLLFFFHFYFPASLHFSTMNVWNIPFLNILLTSYLKTSLRRECQSELAAQMLPIVLNSAGPCRVLCACARVSVMSTGGVKRKSTGASWARHWFPRFTNCVTWPGSLIFCGLLSPTVEMSVTSAGSWGQQEVSSRNP